MSDTGERSTETRLWDHDWQLTVGKTEGKVLLPGSLTCPVPFPGSVSDPREGAVPVTDPKLASK